LGSAEGSVGPAAIAAESTKWNDKKIKVIKITRDFRYFCIHIILAAQKITLNFYLIIQDN
jgi:hypothetical protein